jgi:hypothetical protein
VERALYKRGCARDGAQCIREKAYGAPPARGQTKRTGSLRCFLRLVGDKWLAEIRSPSPTGSTNP